LILQLADCWGFVVSRSVAAVALVLALAGGCSNSDSDPGGTAGGTGAGETTTNGRFVTYADGAHAVTYAPDLVPVGATAEITVSETDGGTTVMLVVGGLKPVRAYGAHLHTRPCGATAADSGPHLQHSHDPAASASPSSADPRYANPTNEVWLDFTTDGSGAAQSSATVDWIFDPAPRALVIHADPTKTDRGVAGTAGARAACLTLPE
jgi:Cu-Zn family superoxide dismutase